ncbi:Ppx/GppA phosphatase family protein [Aurantimonas sp. HBX-1]|uniref:Ppx/GppA phosphatase family protein n=1 Tax=Aurantimonas sp. HBX-1 TaxID=2906072 RepID=UPI001F3620A6|nr:Ppx/GppA phosphatase family protein [Aurantimonas sp. HBX-1]UIJ74024.1 Ppx/GppA family phosphatase [Aurantimonas sp. HBX-1]
MNRETASGPSLTTRARSPQDPRQPAGPPRGPGPDGAPQPGDAPRGTRDSERTAGAPLTKRQRRRRRKAGAKPATPVVAPADVAAEAAKGEAVKLRGARKSRRRGKRRGRAAGDSAPDAATVTQAERQGSATAAGPTRADSSARPVPATPVSPVPASASSRPGQAASGAGTRPPAYAALDLGTNNCRLLIAVPTRPGQFRVIDAFSRIVRLGEGLSRTGSLSRGAMDRAIAALSICAQKLSAREVDLGRARLIATEACRSAANGVEFIEQVKRVTGLDLEIVSRETEARLAVSGCGSLVDQSAEGAVLFDIGGGSSEIALLDLRGGSTRRLASRIVAWTSLPVGVVSLAERHGGRDVSPEIFERMIVETVGMIERFPGRDRLADLIGGERFHLLGTSGTVTTLAGVHLELERYDRRQVDGLWLTDIEADGLVARIASWSFEERVANPCIGSDRADLVLAGCAILEAIRRVWPARTMRVADRGLREGLLTEMMDADGVWRRDNNTAWRASS